MKRWLICASSFATIFYALDNPRSVSAQESVEPKVSEAEKASAVGDHAQADRLWTAVIEMAPDMAAAYYYRGRARFCLGRFRESLADFDKHVAMRPELESRQWERGIAYYYAGQYAKGAGQFQLYQTFHDNDVENSVWRYLCVARTEGVDKARQTMLPIENDRRIPMMQIYDLYRGKLAPEDVLAVVEEGSPPPEARAARLFYAQLYLGLYYEAQGKPQLAKDFIERAANEHREDRGINRYMWEVARVHAEKLADRKDGQ